MDFDLEEVHDLEVRTSKELGALKKSKKLTWLKIDGLNDVELMENLTREFKIENDILSDVMNPLARTKVQEFENGIFTTIKML